MEKSTFSTIKYDSVKDILVLISSREKISRAEIASKTGLSLMTIGKVADALFENDIIIQSKESRSAAGRKAGLISLNPAYYSIVLDIKEKQFRAYVINSELKIISNHLYDLDINYYYDENLYLFLQDTINYYKNDLDMNQCYGAGIILPVNGDAKKTNDIVDKWHENMNHVSEKINPVREILYQTVISSAAALYKSQKLSRRILYIFLGDSMSCAFIADDNVFFSTCFNDVIMHSGQQFNECIKLALTDIKAVNDIALLIYNIIKILSPDEIVFETPNQITSNRLISDIKDRMRKLEINIPFTYTPEIPPSVIGSAYLLRLNWFDVTLRQK